MTSFLQHVFFLVFFVVNIHRSGVLTALTWLVPHETAAVSARSVYTIQPRTMSLHAKYLHISPPLVLEEGFIDLNCELYLFEL